jgi:hypothetical protein
MSLLQSTVSCREHVDSLRELRAELPRVPRADLPGFFDVARRLSEQLPDELRSQLVAFRREGNDDGYLHLRGLPCDPGELPPTPSVTPTPAERELLPMEAWIALVGMCLGEATGYLENRGGGAFQDIYPDPRAHHMTANAAPTTLRYHTEMAYHREQPHYLVIACARPDHERVAATLVSSVRRIVPRLDPEHRRILREVPMPWHVDLAFRSEQDPDPQTGIPVLSEDDDVMRYDRRLIDRDEVPPTARASLDAFSDELDAVAASVYLEQGDVLIVDNFRTSHARTPFTPRWDGTDRWLQRIFVRDPERSDHPVGPSEVVPFFLR